MTKGIKTAVALLKGSIEMTDQRIKAEVDHKDDLQRQIDRLTVDTFMEDDEDCDEFEIDLESIYDRLGHIEDMLDELLEKR